LISYEVCVAVKNWTRDRKVARSMFTSGCLSFCAHMYVHEIVFVFRECCVLWKKN